MKIDAFGYEMEVSEDADGVHGVIFMGENKFEKIVSPTIFGMRSLFDRSMIYVERQLCVRLYRENKHKKEGKYFACGFIGDIAKEAKTKYGEENVFSSVFLSRVFGDFDLDNVSFFTDDEEVKKIKQINKK